MTMIVSNQDRFIIEAEIIEKVIAERGMLLKKKLVELAAAKRQAAAEAKDDGVHESIVLGSVTLYRHDYDGEWIQVLNGQRQLALHSKRIERAIEKLIDEDDDSMPVPTAAPKSAPAAEAIEHGQSILAAHIAENFSKGRK